MCLFQGREAEFRRILHPKGDTCKAQRWEYPMLRCVVLSPKLIISTNSIYQSQINMSELGVILWATCMTACLVQSPCQRQPRPRIVRKRLPKCAADSLSP